MIIIRDINTFYAIRHCLYNFILEDFLFCVTNRMSKQAS